jgi:ubiquinone/menaquinone biosynthesis C-methylase UbiE
MEKQLEEIREQQKAAWNKFSPGWKKWDEFVMNWLKPMGDEIIQTLDLKETDKVLDIASGTGEPAMTIAGIVKKGKVVMTDLAEDMLNVAKEKVKTKGLMNVEIKLADVTELPFENESFDAISCRFGFMFFPDMQVAAKEMLRVLKPGGKFATSVWSTPDKNFWITAIMSVLNKNMDLPAPTPGAPGMFRCGSPGFLAEILRKEGLKNIKEKEILGALKSGNAESYWSFMNDVAAPVVAAMSKADEATKEKVRKEVFEAVNSRLAEKDGAIAYGALVVSGEK